MEEKQIETEYAVHIERKDELYFVYNYFGKQIIRAISLSDAYKQLREYYKGVVGYGKG